jgi:hypothetical protein
MQLIYTKVGCSVLSVMSLTVAYFLLTIVLAVVLGFVVIHNTISIGHSFLFVACTHAEPHMSLYKLQAHQLLCLYCFFHMYFK